MKTKIFTLLFAIIANVGIIFAGDYGHVQIDDLYYNLDTIRQIAEVTCKSYSSTGIINYNIGWNISTANIPSEITYQGTKYNVTSIGFHAFERCDSLTNVIIPNSVTTIDQHAFYGCKNLTSITIPNSVTNIGNHAFSYCYGLTTLTIPNSVTSIGTSAFYGCKKLNSVVLPNRITSIQEATFQACNNLNNITIPQSVKIIGKMAFMASGLSSISIPDSVTIIKEYAFGSCDNLVSISIPCSVIEIGNSAFSSCRSLTSITIPSSVRSIGNSCFFGCLKLTNIYVSPDNANYSSIDGVLFSKDQIRLIRYPQGRQGGYSIPNGVTEVGMAAFSDCSGLIGITIPNSVTTINMSAFYNCTGLTSITIPYSVTLFGQRAFFCCSGLESITCEAAIPPHCQGWTFTNVDTSIPVFVPESSIRAYKSTQEWKDFSNYQAIQAEEVEVSDVFVEPTENGVAVEWFAATDAVSYTITITKDGEIICTLIFNETGQLKSINFAPTSDRTNYDRNTKNATQTTTGWQYSIGGLDANTKYNCNVIAKKSDDSVLYDKIVSFTTESSQGLDDVSSNPERATKILRNNQILILRGYRIYTLTGQEVR